MSSCTQPRSRGTVCLQSNRIKSPPAIDPNYLAMSNDIACTIRATRLAMHLMGTNAFRQMNATIHWPKFDQCKNFVHQNDAIADRYLECLIRVAAVTAHHPAGSCAIGSSKKSCIDSRMRVRGVKRLRVVDASTIPCKAQVMILHSVHAITSNFCFCSCFSSARQRCTARNRRCHCRTSCGNDSQ